MTAYSGRVNRAGTRNDTLCGGKGFDLVNGGDGADFVSGDRGNDTVFGGSGNDTALGGDGNNSLFGGGGNDTVDGGRGDDFISGDRGSDLLTGGAGSDRFYFGGVGGDYGIDTITDFNPGEDKLSFDRNPFSGLGGCSTNFIFRELWGELKSLVIQSLQKNRPKVQARLRAIELSGDRQLPRTAVQFLNLESILPLTNGLCVFLATV
jgi:hypothetical protein